MIKIRSNKKKIANFSSTHKKVNEANCLQLSGCNGLLIPGGALASALVSQAVCSGFESSGGRSGL